ncbi:MAG: DegT/DnrJ/EryC1/StrS family aminotransferase [Oceanospirillaceae bacterium]|nr:DegT/DnrJ/EryC1/StrS family aminotransferase [Oceanospirillaceae bacterium]
MIPVTKPFAPPIEEYQRYLEDIWSRKWFTNNGPLVNDFELKIKQRLNQKHFLFVNNGTIAIQLAIKALGIKKKVITTPFSYVATTSSLVWEGCKPVFVDIQKDTFNIDPAKIEEVIDQDAEAILATHCFGNACDIDAIHAIAKKYNLKVIYDAAHCFGTSYQGKCIFGYGDISTTSFHATKIFHTIEGGGVFSQNPQLLRRMAYMRNFGHDGPEQFQGLGINGKNSEFHAAMGLANLKYIDEILKERKTQFERYDSLLEKLRVEKQRIQKGTDYNYSYYPIVFESEEVTMKMKLELEKREIFPRRYFYPSLSSLNYVEKTETPISDNIASRILCLPLFHDLSVQEQVLISRVLLREQNN